MKYDKLRAKVRKSYYQMWMLLLTIHWLANYTGNPLLAATAKHLHDAWRTMADYINEGGESSDP